MYMLAAQGWCPWCGSHMWWGGGWIMMLFWLVALAAVLWFAWSVVRRGSGPGGPRVGSDAAEAILRERYARGEIDEETYHRMSDELQPR